MSDPRRETPRCETVDTKGLCAMLGRSTDWFYRNRRSLEAEHGFPKPLPGLGYAWSKVEVRRWLHRPAEVETSGGPLPKIEFEDLSDELARRAAELADLAAGGGSGQPH